MLFLGCGFLSSSGLIQYIIEKKSRDEEEALQAGVEECLLSGNLCLVEWPEKAPSLLPLDSYHINIAVLDEETRTISVTGM